MIPITIEDLADAYRKAKVDLFYSGNPCRISISKFEDKLLKNLLEIQDALNNKDMKYLLRNSEGYWLCPKKIHLKYDDNKTTNNFIVSDPEAATPIEKIERVDLRIIEKLPIAFHVITTLWINKIGERFDGKLSPASYGNRIRRHKDKTPNLRALGSFNPYLHHYRTWRDNGLKAIRTGLEKGENIIAITADFSAFYHNIDASFIVSNEFQSKIGIELNEDEKEFTSLIVSMLNHWAKKTPLKHGLPVGCSVSAVIANMALALFDDSIEKEIVPLYYGRYVDDIILVLKNTNGFTEQSDVWNWIAKRVSNLIVEKDKNSDKECIIYDMSAYYSTLTLKNTTCKLFFEGNKTKIFLLVPPSGLAFLDSLEHQIKEHSSEWRSMPELPDERFIPSMLLTACNKTGEEADNLRKADSLSTKRALFAMKLRDIEAYCRNLPQAYWEKQRIAFLETIDSYFTNLSCYFELFRYFPRILSIATECADYEFVVSIAAKVFRNCIKIPKDIISISNYPVKSKRSEDVFELFIDYVTSSFRESIIASISFPFSSEKLNSVFLQCPWLKFQGTTKQIKELHRDLSGYDLASKPFRYFSFYKEIFWPFDQKGTWATYFYSDETKIPPFVRESDYSILKWLASNCIKPLLVPGVPQAWIFPTRPFNMPELYLCIDNAFGNSSYISIILCVLRGYAKHEQSMPAVTSEKDIPHNHILEIQNNRISSKINIALTSWKTEQSSWTASVCQRNDPDLTRYQRMAHLLNHILTSHVHVDYVVFPELSIPLRWFLGIANKLKNSGISLIGGVEYLHPQEGVVSNQVWCSLIHNGLGFSQSVIVKHDKAFPAIHEEHQLRDTAGIILRPEKQSSICPIIKHGNFFFGVLICSELTNIDYRAKFRGNVDAIFVPEWNQDTEMFSSLIEAAAYDVHAYIIQCNDRQYGDTRIRIPAKNNYYRDLVKIKGGEEDFFVIGKLDIKKLRQFQSYKNSPTGESVPFKPIPIGFQIAPYRKCLPKE